MLKSFDKAKDDIVKKQKVAYLALHKTILKSVETNKLSTTLTDQQIKELSKKNIRVLLYELSTQYKTYNIICSKSCNFFVDDQPIAATTGTINITGDKLQLILNGTIYTPNKVQVRAEIISITNYKRKSYKGIPRNTFREGIEFVKEPMKDLKGKESTRWILINDLSFEKYMK